MQVKLKKEDFQAMAAHAIANLPEEACGLIAGEKSDTERVIKKVYYLTNIDHTNEHFSLDPKEQLAAIKDMRKNGLEPLGNWHSHPETPARPSQEDIRLAFDSEASYLIMSLMDQENPVIHAFRVREGQVSKDEDCNDLIHLEKTNEKRNTTISHLLCSRCV